MSTSARRLRFMRNATTVSRRRRSFYVAMKIVRNKWVREARAKEPVGNF